MASNMECIYSFMPMDLIELIYVLICLAINIIDLLLVTK